VVTLDRLVEEALVRYDAEEAHRRAEVAAESRHADVHLQHVGHDGTAEVTATVDLPDAVDLEEVLTRGAARLKEQGCTDPLPVRRAKALGMLARGELFTDDESAIAPARRITLHLHAAADPTGSGLVRVEETGGFLLLDTLPGWCADPGTQLDVRPVLDLAGHISVGAYEVPDRLKQRTRLLNPTCVFPWCTRPAQRCDCDHVVPHEQGGSTCSCNIAPLCRGHHRLKTRGGWNYTKLDATSYLWHSPHGHSYLRDHHGTEAQP
jgi:hypothetical protein